MAVSGSTITRADRHSRQSRESQTHRNLSEPVRRTLCERAEREGPRADAEGQGSRLESQPEFEIFPELNRAARE